MPTSASHLGAFSTAFVEAFANLISECVWSDNPPRYSDFNNFEKGNSDHGKCDDFRIDYVRSGDNHQNKHGWK